MVCSRSSGLGTVRGCHREDLRIIRGGRREQGMRERRRVELGGWGRGWQTALQTSGLWEKWFLIQPALSGQIALTTNRVSPFSEQGLMAEKGRPSPLDKPWEFERRQYLARRGQIESRRLGS